MWIACRVACFGASSPAHGFNVDTLYRLLEAKRRYVRACDYDYDYEMSRVQEAIVLLKDAGAYSITIDEESFLAYKKATGKDAKLSVPIATPIGDVGAAGGAASHAGTADHEDRTSRSLGTIFSNKPEHGRYYNPDGKWFYSNGLQEKTVELIVSAVEGGREPPTLETTIHFKREKADTETSQMSAALQRLDANNSLVQVIGLGRSCKNESKTEFEFSFHVIMFSKEDMDKVKGVVPPAAHATESLRRSGAELANLRLDFYDDRRHLREDVVVHLARGDVLIEELTSDMLIEDTFTEKQKRARLEAVFSGESGSLKDWLGALRLGEYHDKFVDNGFDNLVRLALVKEEDLGTMGITKAGHKRELVNALKALKDASEQRRRGADSRPAAVHELAQAAFFNRQVTEPGLSLVMPFTLYGPGPMGGERTSALFTWDEAINGSPGEFMSGGYAAAVKWNKCAESPGRYRFCKGLKFGKGSADRNQQSLDKVTADDYAAMSDKNHAEIWMHDTHPAIDPYTIKNGNPLPFGLLVLVLDYAEVAAAHAETIETSRAGPLTCDAGPLLQALLDKVLPLLGMTFKDLKNNTPTGNSLRDKVLGAQSKSPRGTLLRYPPLATLLVDNDTAALSTGVVVVTKDYDAVCTWLREFFQLTYVFAMAKLAPPTSDERTLFHSNISFKPKYLNEWNRRAFQSLTVLSQIVSAAAHHEQVAAAKLRAASSGSRA